jgi:hypothetical protein
MDHAQVIRFCWQCLQGDPAPDFPEPDQLRQEQVQEFIHAHLFSDEIPLRPPVRYRVRILKQLISKIEDSIEDWEQHVSDNVAWDLGTPD